MFARKCQKDNSSMDVNAKKKLVVEIDEHSLILHPLQMWIMAELFHQNVQNYRHQNDVHLKSGISDQRFST